MRLALVASFPVPAPQGSQRFLALQARALREAGHEVELVCYGGGDGRPAPAPVVHRTPRALAPRGWRSGLSPWRATADAGLAAALAGAAARRPFDATLAHHVEAALAARLVPRRARGPLLYVAHTLLAEELGAYLPAGLARAAGVLGRVLDAAAVRAADAVLALSPRGRARLAALARGPAACAPPPWPAETPPDAEAVRRACARHGLTPDSYAVYAGNLDRYQDLPLLDAAAARLPELPCVAVVHDPRGVRLRHVRVVVAGSPDEARHLVHGARLAVAPRRRAAGFPVKLLAYLEAALPVVALEGAAGTLAHDRCGWLLPEDATPDALAAALRRVAEDSALAARLGRGGRALLERTHAPARHAEAVIALAEDARASAMTAASARPPRVASKASRSA